MRVLKKTENYPKRDKMGNIKDTFLKRIEFDEKNSLFVFPKPGSVYTEY